MHSSGNPNQQRMRQERNRLLARIDHLCTRGPKHLDTEQRLRAALFIREQYEALTRYQGSLRVADLEEKLGEIGEGLSGIRIHRWMVRASEREVTQDMIQHYDDRPEPLKKTRVYFELAAALARIGGDDPVETKIALLRRTNLDAASVGGDNDLEVGQFDASAGLLRLVRNFASDTAHRLDLASLFERVERLQAGWSPQDEGNVFSMVNAMQRYSRSTIFSGAWMMDELPALPSVRLAEFPLATLIGAEVRLGCGGDKVTLAVGDLVATWSLRLTIVPDARAGVTPALIRTSRLWFSCTPDTGGVSDETCEIAHSGDGLDELVPDNGRQPHLIHDPRMTIEFTSETATRYLNLCKGGQIYVRTTPEEDLPHETIPCAAIEPLDPARMRLWFRDGAGRENDLIERAPLIDFGPGFGKGQATEWFNTPCLGRDLELAIRHGRLRSDFSRTASSIRRSLETLEKRRLSEMSAADRELFETWAAERAELDGRADESC